MDTFMWIAVFSLAVLGPILTHANDVEIQISPAGEIKEGDVVTITCTSPGLGSFDVMKLVRKIGPVKHDIMVNTNLMAGFSNTGRYASKTQNTDFAAGKIIMEINGITGADRGEFECYDLTKESGAVENINVFVPPASLKIEYMNDNSGYVSVAAGSDAENVVFISGTKTGIKCVVDVDGSTTKPEITLNIGDMDGTRRFSLDEVNINNVDSIGLYETSNTYTYTEELDTPNTDDNGKTFTCQAKMPNHDTVLTASINMEVHYPPALNCDAQMTKAKVGDDKKIKCTATMHPKYTTAMWSWQEGGQEVSVSADNTESDDKNFHFMTTEDGNSYTFTLHIKAVDEDDFTDYKLTVDNGVGNKQEFSVSLQEEVTTTPKPVTTTSKPKGVSTVVDTGSDASSTSPVSKLLATLVTIFIILFNKL